MAVTVAWLGQEHSSEVFPSVTDPNEDLGNIFSSSSGRIVGDMYCDRIPFGF